MITDELLRKENIMDLCEVYNTDEKTVAEIYDRDISIYRNIVNRIFCDKRLENIHDLCYFNTSFHLNFMFRKTKPDRKDRGMLKI